MSSEPKVSFVIRTKNEARFIGKVLSFLEQQAYKNIEIIVVDSGSTDKTLEIVNQHNVRLYHIPPEDFSFSYALNYAIAKAKGEYIGILSGHSVPISDTWLVDGIANFVGEVVGVTGHYTDDGVGYYSRYLGKLLMRWRHFSREENTPWMTNTNALIRKSAWKLYPFDESLAMCEDYDWACEMLARGYRVVKDPKFNVFHAHWLLGRPGYVKMLPKWKKACKEIDKRSRPYSPPSSQKRAN